MVNYAKSGGPLRMTIATAEDTDVLLAVKKAVQQGLVEPILIGNEYKIKSMMESYAYNFQAEIIDAKNDAEACEKSVKMISQGEAQMVMKGLVQTSTFLKAVLNKEWGLRQGELLSFISMFIFADSLRKRPILMTDPAINIMPTVLEKKAIIENAVSVAQKLGVKTPNVALVCAVETVSPNMQATIDAAVLSKMNDRGQIKGCVVDGPLAFDNIISMNAAEHKGIKSPVAGNTDIIVVPYIEVGNVLYKTFNFFHVEFCAGVIAGARAPIVVTSRSDSHEVKYNSIVMASLLSKAEQKLH
ncbi:MAG TPA: phosphate butyryltransferase [Lentisphaeria bacterium]|nr:phosphate butyryltransferase [Lentisphaeria bacterium]